MMRHCFLLHLLAVLGAMVGGAGAAKGAGTTPQPTGEHFAGFLGKAYNEPDFRRIKRVLEPEARLDEYFDDGVGHGLDWSGVWEGYIVAPATGRLSLHLEAWKPTVLDMWDRGSVRADGSSNAPARQTLTLSVTRGEALPFKISYAHAHGGRGGWKVTWSIDDGTPEPIPESALFFDERVANNYHWKPDPDRAAVDWARFATVEKHDVVVFHEPGRAAGWPANQGFYAWGDEILQTYDKGYSLDRNLNHSIDPTRPGDDCQARSRDGGETWNEEPSVEERPAPGESSFPPAGLGFDDPGFALKTYHDHFWFSLNRGQTWRGPYRWPDLGMGPYTNRTDYIRLGRRSALFGFSAEDPGIESQHNDRCFFVRAGDNGHEMHVLGWLTPSDDLARAVMPSSVRLGDGHFLTAVRRKLEESFPDAPPIARNWIELFESTDGAETWRSLGEVAETDNGRQNGNPPSLVPLGGKRLAVIYGYRGVPETIRARLSEDLGRTWSPEILLRRDSTSWDMGYVRSAVRADGKVVSIYYLPTKKRPELHFEATIWDPGTYQAPGHMNSADSWRKDFPIVRGRDGARPPSRGPGPRHLH